MRTKIEEWAFPNGAWVGAPSEDESDHLLFTLCTPSDRKRSEFADEYVVIITWRSPMGDDLHVTLPEWTVEDFTRELAKAKAKAS